MTKLPINRDFNPSNPHLEDDISNFLSTPISLKAPTKSPIDFNDPKNRYHIHKVHIKTTTRSSLPVTSFSHNDTLKNTEQQYEIDRAKSGPRRAFDIKHKRYTESVLRQQHKKWEQDEKFYQWKTEKQRRLIEVRHNDHHVIEHVIQSRNDYYMSTLGNKNSSPTSRNYYRTAPVEIRFPKTKCNYYS